MSRRPIVAALGDSLTAGEHVDGTVLHNHSYPSYVGADLFPEADVANFGLGGDLVAGMQTRYTNYIKNVGYDMLFLWGGVNNIIQNHTAASIWATMEALIDEVISDGLPVVLIATPAFGGYSGWSAPRQAQYDALVVLMAAKTGVRFINLNVPQPEGMNDSLTPASLYSPYSFSDGLHINPKGALHLAKIITPVLRLVYPAPSTIAAPEAISVPQTARRPPFIVKRGDLRPSLRMALLGRDGAPLTLPSGSTVRFRMRAAAADPGDLKIDAAAVIEDADTATVRYDWQGTDTDTNADYLAEFRRVLASGQETVPGESFIAIRVIDPA